MATTDLDALIEERDMYLARGRKDRAAECDRSIKALSGVVVEAAVEVPVVETADKPAPRTRKAKG